MKLSDAKTICILGRQPVLGLAELESLYGAERVLPLGEHAVLDIPAEEINFKNLGGTIKTARLLAVIDSSDWKVIAGYLIENVPTHVGHLPEGKFTLGLSAYGINTSVKAIEATLLEIKKRVRKAGRPVRVVPNKERFLNSAQVLHNKLTHKGAWELIVIKAGSRALLAQTLFVQDIEAYGARDQGRPARDARVGMLPPKLAQIMLNLSAGPLRPGAPELERLRILDPFCGTGVVLQEAVLMGYSVLGTDIEPRMADYSKKNLRWLYEKFPSLEGQVDIEVGDATTYRWPGFSAVASEVFLGRPLAKLPEDSELEKIISDADTITKKFLRNLIKQLKADRPICLAVPAWRRPDGKFIELPILAKLTDMGYNYWDLKHVRHQELVYYREDQIVARRLLRLKKE